MKKTILRFIFAVGVFALMAIISFGNVNTVKAQTTVQPCQILTSNLTVGSTGPEVVILQNFLISKGYLVTSDLGYFGALTKSAVSNYQADKRISPTDGYVGPLTRSIINSELTCTTTSTPVPASVLKLTSPNQGETLKAGQTVTVSWLASGLPSNAVIGLQYKDEKLLRNYNLASSSLPRSFTSYSWKLPTNIAPGRYYISVHCSIPGSEAGCGSDSSDVPVTIVESGLPNNYPTFVSAPQVPATTIGIGESVNIKWFPYDMDGDTIGWKLDYGNGYSTGNPCPNPNVNPNGNVISEKIGYAKRGTYNVTMTIYDCRGGQASISPITIKVIDQAVLNTGSVKVVSPNGGESYIQGQNIPFKWSVSNVPSDYIISAYFVSANDPKTFVSEIAPAYCTPLKSCISASIGATTIRIPENIKPGKYQIYVDCRPRNSEDTGKCMPGDLSDAPFTINSKDTPTTNTNLIPRVVSTSSSPQSVYVGDMVSFNVNVIDGNGDDIYWNFDPTGRGEAISCPIPANHSRNSRNWNGLFTYTWNTPGTYKVVAGMTDCQDGTPFKWTYFYVTVKERPVVPVVPATVSLISKEAVNTIKATEPGQYDEYSVNMKISVTAPSTGSILVKKNLGLFGSLFDQYGNKVSAAQYVISGVESGATQVGDAFKIEKGATAVLKLTLTPSYISYPNSIPKAGWYTVTLEDIRYSLALPDGTARFVKDIIPSPIKYTNAYYINVISKPIKITGPNGGESYKVGSSIKVEFSTTLSGQSHVLQLVPQFGTANISLTKTVITGSGDFGMSAIIPNTVTPGNYFVKVCTYCGTATESSDESDSYIFVVPATTPTVTAQPASTYEALFKYYKNLFGVKE